jgi:iron-sulfur cluster assembly protein
MPNFSHPDMMQLSPAAAAEINRLQSCQAKPGEVFRLSVTPTGCAGLFYAMQFAVPQPNDQPHQSNGVAILIDPHSLSYLEDVTLDYAEDLMGGGFRFHNPQAQKSCGCGLSFSITEECAQS